MKAVVTILLVATVAHAQPSKRSHVEKRLADALNDIKQCGKRFTASYDWAAFDAIDFAAAGKDKREIYDYESSNMEYLGIGINNKCKDPDYKAMLAKVDAIVYRPSGDKSIRLVATVDGTTLIFTNNVFGSTRDYNDYEGALENAQVTGTAPPPTTHGVAAPTGPASRATVAYALPYKRSHVEKRLADALKDIKECGKRFTASYDWAAFDAIDFAAAGKDKREINGYEGSNMEYLGIGINNMCKDPDYKAMLAKVDAIVYRPSGDKSIRLVATVDGTTLIFTNNVFGSTRDYHDYENALENAQVTSTAPPPTTHGVAAPTGRASRAWDGTYPMKAMGGLGGLCPRNDLVGNLVVKGGKFSFPWIADDWSGGPSGAAWSSKTIETGRVMGLVHADGTTTTTVAFTHPGLTSQRPSIVKVKRLLDAVTTVPITFTKHGKGGRVVHGSVDVYHEAHTSACVLDWEIRDPAEVEAERREAARPRTKAEKAAEAKQELRYKCEERCRSKAGDCEQDHCTRQKETCERRCGNDSSCSSNCDSDNRSCRSTCSDEEDSCRRDCDHD